MILYVELISVSKYHGIDVIYKAQMFKKLTALIDSSRLGITSQLLLQPLGLCNQVLDWNLIHQGCRVRLWLLLHQGLQTQQGEKVKS